MQWMRPSERFVQNPWFLWILYAIIFRLAIFLCFWFHRLTMWQRAYSIRQPVTHIQQCRLLRYTIYFVYPKLPTFAPDTEKCAHLSEIFSNSSGRSAHLLCWPYKNVAVSRYPAHRKAISNGWIRNGSMGYLYCYDI